jgi:hypothetical protein
MRPFFSSARVYSDHGASIAHTTALGARTTPSPATSSHSGSSGADSSGSGHTLSTTSKVAGAYSHHLTHDQPDLKCSGLPRPTPGSESIMLRALSVGQPTIRTRSRRDSGRRDSVVEGRVPRPCRRRKLLRTFDYTASNWRRVRYQDPELVVTEPASTSATQTAAYLSSSPTPLGISLGDERKGHLKRAGP